MQPCRLLALSLAAGIASCAFIAAPLQAAERPTVAQALELKPLQADVDYDTPTPQQLEKCSIKSEIAGNMSGWVVIGELGQPLRRFLDSNRDNNVDLWCYFKNGVEVYRDIDADFDGRADQYRWLSTAGTRWGLDPNEDGTIDSWKAISAEEVSAEVVAALRDGDMARFSRLLPSPEELASLGLGARQMESIKKGVAAARSGFSNLAKDQKLVPPKSSWIQFGGTRPGIVPAGTDGSANDVLVYDNVAAIVDNGGKPGQLVIGTLIHVDQGWRVIDLPKGEASEGFFVPAPARPQQSPTQITEGIDERVQKLINDLEKLDQNLLASQPTDRAKLHAQRADLLEQLAEHAGNDNERRSWIRQFADTVSAAVQSGEYPDGIERLRKILDKVNAPTEPKDLVACVRFRLLTAENGQKMSQPNVDFPKLHAQWVTDLESFVKEFPKSEETADAMLQLGLAQEFSGKDQDAVSWYSRITADFPDVPHAKKAAGAKRRLEAVGTPFELQGKTFNGAAFDLGRMRGKVVLIHYWATWCEPCKRDMEAMRAVQAKYATRGFTLVGVNLDTDPRLLEQYVKAQRLAWPQLYEPGGLDSRLATEMGILTLPTMLLVDQSGRVVRRSIQVGELEQELSNLLK